MKEIKINGNPYTRKELNEKSDKDLIIEIVIAIAGLQEHIKVQDNANNNRFRIHEILIISVILGSILVKLFT